MPRILISVFTLLALVLAPASASAQAHPKSGKPGPYPGGPPAPGGPLAPQLSFQDSLAYAARAAAVARQLQAGPLSLRRTPQGQRLSLGLLYLGRQVASVTLRPDLGFAEQTSVPLLPEVKQLPVLADPERQLLAAQVRALATSGLGLAAGPQVRVTLLSDGAAVADLRFDRATGVLLAQPPGKKPQDDRKAPKK